MKRDPRLHRLSAEHHRALVLARRLLARGAGATGDLRARFDAELAPHFELEERILLPALRALGEGAIADRIAAEHVAMREQVAGAAAGDADAARAFAVALEAHVRFEERTLFPICEELLPSRVLDALAAG